MYICLYIYIYIYIYIHTFLYASKDQSFLGLVNVFLFNAIAVQERIC